jgi:aldose 1-epimerase
MLYSMLTGNCNVFIVHDHLFYLLYIAQGKYEFFNASYQLPLNENTTDPPRHNALHGLMPGRKLAVTGSQITTSHASLQLSYHFDKPLPGYPFTFDVVINYTLSDSGFSMHFSVTNRMESFPMPFYMGWHPYFVCTAYKTYVVLDKCTTWNHVELNTNMDPTGITKLYHGLNGSQPIGGTETNPTFFDDEFKPVSPDSPECNVIQTRLYDVDTSQMAVLWQDSSFRLVHVFTGSESLFHEDAIAVEPMSGMADAYNNHDHLSVLSGGETWSGSVGVYVE